jgi:hypothetical protein
MIQHIVLLDPAEDPGLTRIAEAMHILATLPGRVHGFIDFQHGPNRDFEGKSQRYPYGFVCSFTDRAALDAYSADADHQRAGAMLVAACGGAANIFVADLEV